jgi:hypothetical protein
VKLRCFALVGTALLLAWSRVAAAQSINVSPSSVGTLRISAAVAGQEPTTVVLSGGTYTLKMKKNQGIRTITARLNTPLPAGTTLTITLASPGGAAQSTGPVALSTSSRDVVTNIPNSKKNYAAAAITYRLSATTDAGVVASRSVRVMLTLDN